MHTDCYDLVIVGGGSTGLSLLLGLKKHLLQGTLTKVALVDRAAPVKLPGRAIALNSHTLDYFNNCTFALKNEQGQLQELNTLSYLAADLEPITNIIVQTDTNAQSLRLEAAKHHLDQFGGVIDLATLQLKLADLAQLIQLECAQAGRKVTIDFLQNWTVSKNTLGPYQDGPACADSSLADALRAEQAEQAQNLVRTLKLHNAATNEDKSICAHLVLQAAGSGELANNAHAAVSVFHNQLGIICDVELNQPLHGAAIEYFSEHGPVAFLPTSANTACVVWCEELEQESLTPTGQTKPTSLRLDPEVLLGKLNLVLENIDVRSLGDKAELNKPLQAVKISSTASFVLNATNRKNYSQALQAYIGNAAHTLHPVSGQGFNLAILGLDAFIAACDKYAPEVSQGKSFADIAQLIIQDYQRLHHPIAQEVFERTNMLAGEFTRRGKSNPFVRDFALYHLIGYPGLQKQIVDPSLGLVKPQQFKALYSLLAWF